MADLAFPNGQIVRTEFDDAQHTYQVAHKLADGRFSDFRPTHGITEPLNTVPKPYLKPWAAKMATLATLDHIMDYPQVVETLPRFFVDLDLYENKVLDEKGKKVMTYYRFNKTYPWYKQVKGAADSKSKDSMELGTWLHAAIEEFYKSSRKKLPVLTDFVEPLWNSFRQFDNYYKPTPDKDGLEFLVYSLMFGYSGQGDFRGQINDKYCIGDFKTTNRSDANADGISVEYFFQDGGLAQAEFERTGKWVDDLFVANLDKKGEEPRVIFASDFGASPQDMARAYIGCFNTDHTIKDWDYKFNKR